MKNKLMKMVKKQEVELVKVKENVAWKGKSDFISE